MDNNEINAIVMKVRENEAKVKELQDTIDSLKEQLKSEMVARDVNELNTNIFALRLKEVVSNRFDSKTFKSEHSDLYNQYLKESVATRFTIQ